MMSDNEIIFSEVENTIKERRERAEREHRLRIMKTEERIPEIKELNRYLSEMSRRLIGLVMSGDENIGEKIEQERKSSVQANMMIKDILVKNGYPEDYLEIPYTCDKCSDTGTSDGRRCECFKNMVKNLRIKKMNENAQIKLSSFDTFRLDYYDAYISSMREIYNYCVRYAENFEPASSGSIIMQGKTGLGKTHLSLAIANEVIGKGYSVVYDSVINLLRKIENEHFGRDTSGNDTLEVILNTDLLILDDLGSEYDSKFYVSVIYNIINTRINKSLPVIVNTNLPTKQIEEKYDARITSRLLSEYDLLSFMGKDIRQLKKMEKFQSY